MRLIITKIIVLLPFLGFSQDDRKLMATCEYVDGTVKIRWVPTDFETWEKGINEGYTLERLTIEENGVVNEWSDILNENNIPVLLSNNVPIPDTDADWAPYTSEFAKLIRKSIHYTEERNMPDPVQGPSFADAVYAEEVEESRHIFSLFAAEQDFEAAMAAGWGAIDNESPPIQSNNKYYYKVSLGDEITAICILDTSTETEFPPVGDFEVQGKDLAVTLNWRIDDIAERYSAYDIERSSNGSSFQAVNDVPFVFMNATDKDINFAMYTDELTENGVQYEYRIRGISPFGTRGEASEVLSAAGVAPRILGLSFIINEAMVSEETVMLSWENLEAEIEAQMVEWRILRADSDQGNYELLTTSSSPISTFEDINPLKQGYYVLELTDQNGHIYQSPSRFAQLEDNTPPDIPTGLEAEFVTGKDVRIKWNKNSDDDLEGYYLYASNGMNAYFSVIHSDIIDGDSIEFIHTVNEEFIVDNIYFTIAAQDVRGNLSEESEAIEIARPDMIAPAAPDIYKIQPLAEGIGIGWKFSDSDDVVRHELQRKKTYGAEWEVILEILVDDQGEYLDDMTPGSLTSICYIDEDPLLKEFYDYRILAFDEAENISNSEIVSAIPMTSRIVGEINNFRKISLEEMEPAALPIPDAWEAINNLISEYEAGNPGGKAVVIPDLQTLVIFSVISQDEMDEIINGDNAEVIIVFLVERRDSFWAQFTLYELTLGWDYENMEALSAVKIYRSKDGGEIIEYDMVGITDITDIADFTYVDTDIRKDSDYLYQITMLHDGGVTSAKSDVLFIRVQ